MIQTMATENPRKHRASLPIRFVPSEARTSVKREKRRPDELKTMGGRRESDSPVATEVEDRSELELWNMKRT